MQIVKNENVVGFTSLGVMERLMLLGILPTEGDILTLRIVRDLSAELSFSEAEHAELKIRQEGPRILWDRNAEKPKSIAIGPVAHAMITGILTKLSENKTLKLEQLSIYELFVNDHS